MKPVDRFTLILLMCLATICSCSQSPPLKKDIARDSFAGSTPCNTEVNRVLNIPASDPCEFMKWELNLYHTKSKDTRFNLLVSYGDYLPNTPLFAGGGKSIQDSGQVVISHITRNGTSYKILHLNGNKSALLFIELDSNILHFIDGNMKLVKGDASHAFILNRIEVPQKK